MLTYNELKDRYTYCVQRAVDARAESDEWNKWWDKAEMYQRQMQEYESVLSEVGIAREHVS